MKYLNFSKQCSLIVGAAIVLFSSCKKVENFEPIGDGGQKYVKIIDYGGINGTSGFSASALVLDLSLPTEIVPVQLELTTAHVYDHDITVTVGYSAAKLTAFNAAQPAGGIIFQSLTAAQYSLSKTTVKIKAGQTMSETFNIIFHPDQLNIALSYMLPIEIVSITGGNGEIIAPGTGTAYFHIIGNPLAGNYSDIGIRYNYTGAVAWSGPPAVLALSTAPDVPSMGNPPGGTVQTTYPNVIKQALPVDAQTVYMSFGNVPMPGSTAGADYYITGNATYSAITYDFNSAFKAGYSAINKWVRSYTGPTPKASYRLITQYNNAVAGAGGSDRIIDESFRQQ